MGTRVTPPDRGEEFAESLMLLRASTLKMLRFQLALERRDRRAAIEEMDDLLAIDRRLQDYLSETCEEDELHGERAALNREKLTLAAGVIRREPFAELPQPPAPETITAEAPHSEAWGSFAFAEADRSRRRRAAGFFAAALLLLVLAAAIYWLGPQIATWTQLGGT